MKRAIACLIPLLLVGSAHANSYTFSYLFGNGDLLSGSLDGTPIGNLVTDLANITVSINGSPATEAMIYGSSYDGDHYISGGAVASFDGIENNFLFTDIDYDSATNASGESFYFLSHVFQGALIWDYGITNVFATDDYPGATDNWSLTENSVPDTASSLGLLSSSLIALMGLALRTLNHPEKPFLPRAGQGVPQSWAGRIL